MGICTIWGIATIFALAFQCQLPQPWNTVTGVCHDIKMLYQSIGIIDLITDFVITGLPLVTLVNLQMQQGTKLTVMACFLARLR